MLAGDLANTLCELLASFWRGVWRLIASSFDLQIISWQSALTWVIGAALAKVETFHGILCLITYAILFQLLF